MKKLHTFIFTAFLSSTTLVSCASKPSKPEPTAIVSEALANVGYERSEETLEIGALGECQPGEGAMGRPLCILTEALDAKEDAFLDCQRRSIEGGRYTTGQVLLDVEISKEGIVSAKVLQAPLNDRMLAQCTREIVHGLTIELEELKTSHFHNFPVAYIAATGQDLASVRAAKETIRTRCLGGKRGPGTQLGRVTLDVFLFPSGYVDRLQSDGSGNAAQASQCIFEVLKEVRFAARDDVTSFNVELNFDE